jgi:hypothetical protein
MDLEKLCSCAVKIGDGLGQGLGCSFTLILTNVGILIEFIIACVQVGGNMVIIVSNVLYCMDLLNLFFRLVYVCYCHQHFRSQI